MTTRETVYAVLVALGVLLPMYYNVQYMGADGSLLVDFFTVPMESAVTASLLFDLLIAFVAYNVWLFSEGRTLGARKFYYLHCGFVAGGVCRRPAAIPIAPRATETARIIASVIVRGPQTLPLRFDTAGTTVA